MIKPNAPICPDCGNPMRTIVLDFRNPDRSSARWECRPCGKLMAQQPKARPINSFLPIIDPDNEHEDAVA